MEELKKEYNDTTITELKYRINFCRGFLNKITFYKQKINFTKLNLIHSIQVECNAIKQLIDNKVSEIILNINKQEIEKQNKLNITQNKVKTELNILEHCLTQFNKNKIKNNKNNKDIINIINNQLYFIKNEFKLNISTFKYHNIIFNKILFNKFINSFIVKTIDTDIGKYIYKKELWDTLQGRIYLGEDITTETEVIIKEGWKHLINSKISRNHKKIAENFKNEAKLSLLLSQKADCPEYICKTYDIWEKDDAYYYSMEKCDISLFDYVKQYSDKLNKKIYFEQIRDIFINIIVGVNWLHNNNICHLDLSLENIMLKKKDKKYIAKIIDFGLAQKISKKNPYCHKTVGKLSYICPESYQKQRYNGKKADIYSLGVILFTMLTGSLPYTKPSVSDTTYKLIKNNKMNHALKYLGITHQIDKNGHDLVQKMLLPECKRISMKQIIYHPFLNKNRNISQHNSY